MTKWASPDHSFTKHCHMKLSSLGQRKDSSPFQGLRLIVGSRKDDWLTFASCDFWVTLADIVLRVRIASIDENASIWLEIRCIILLLPPLFEDNQISFRSRTILSKSPLVVDFLDFLKSWPKVKNLNALLSEKSFVAKYNSGSITKYT